MANHTGLSPQDPNKYLGPNVYLTLCVTRSRAPTSADFRQPETGKLYPFNSFWLVGKDPTTGTQGDLWYLSKIAANVAYWVKVATSSAGPVINIAVDAFTPPGTDPVVSDVNGLITVTGAQVAAGAVGTNVIRTDSLAANEFTIEIQRSTAVASSDLVNNGVCHFSSSQFTVDSNGFVELFGDFATQTFAVDASTAPGTNPVTPTMLGVVTITGGQVAAETTANVIRTDSLAANTYTIEIQRSTAKASSTVGSNGVSHFDSANFTVDADGFVSLSGTGAGETITGDSGGALSPTAGNWNIFGASTAAGTSPVTTSGAVSTLTVNVQKSQAIASTDATKVGLAAFDSAFFSVDANGFVSSTGQGMVWQTISANQTLVVNHGYICISPGGALSLALPATATIGQIIEVTLDGATSWTITQSAGQQIRYGNLQTTSGASGTLASTAAGNTIRMVAQTATKWNVISALGTLVVT